MLYFGSFKRYRSTFYEFSKIKSSPKSITVLNIFKKCLTKSKSAEKIIKEENYIMETSFLKKSPILTNKLSRAKRNFSVPYDDIKSPDGIR